MGLPEIADFARNFAVMVRIQGPDPKGLKMRNHAFHHYNSGRTTLSASGMLFPVSNGNTSTGSSGDITSSGTILVLTVASVIEPFVSQQYKESTLKDKACLIPGVQIDILVEGKSVVEDHDELANMESLPWLPAELLNIVDIPPSSVAVQSLIEASCGSMENGWEVGWSLASHSRGPHHITESSRAQVEQSSFRSQWHMPGIDTSNPSFMGQSATRIALLTIPFKESMVISFFPQKFSKLQTSVPKRGDLLLAMGSPFGILSPVHFFNNISVGSVGNSYPPSSFSRSLLMADIRCLPGMEGSPVFNENSQFVGLLARPLRQKISGTEIQLVIPWEAIASSCSDLVQEEPHITWKAINYNDGKLDGVGKLLKGYTEELPTRLREHIHSGSQLLSPVEKAMASICLIATDDGSWASGVLLNKQGLVLTNAHLLEPWRFGKTPANGLRNTTKLEVAITPTNESVRMEPETFYSDKSSQNPLTTNLKEADISPSYENSLSGRSSASISQRGIRVRLDFMDPWLWTDASIVYISKGPLDVALLQLEIAPDQLCPIVMDFSCPSPGSKAYVIGHGLFGPRCDFLPSACLGVISKVIEAKGALQHRSNQSNLSEHFPAMLETTAAVHPGSSGGAVVNSDGLMIGLVTSNAKHGGGTVIPHLNFSIPCAALEPIFKFSEDMQDFSILDELDKPNEHLSSVWALMPPLYPKQAPLLPDRLQIPAEDNSKDMSKGSRFSKFIAERNELLKNTGHPGKTGSFCNDFVRSKL